MIQENLNQFSSKLNTNQKKTIFSKNNEAIQIDATKCFNHQNIQIKLKCCIRKFLRKKQNLNFQEGFKNLKQNRKLEGYSNDVQVQQHQCFSYFNQALQNARSLKSLDLSGMDIDPLLAIEIGQAIQKNSSLLDINLSGCNLNSSSLQYIFSSISNHQTLQSINLFNNQGFNQDLVNDICQFVFKGKNCLKKLKLTHCNISSTSISYLLRNLKYSKTITQLDLSMMDFTTDVLTSLGMALQHYKGQKKILEYLNIGYSHIKNSGLEVLASRVSWNMRNINIKELILKRNFIDQQGIPYLETFLQKINYLQRLDLSQNNIEEFNCQNLLQRQLYEINLSQNLFQYFPQYFFPNTLVINLSSNNISSQGAFQLSSILRQNPLWIELNLSNNNIKSEGFNSLIFGLRDNTQLKKIIVTNNNIDGEGLFTYMINHEQVSFEYLDISYNYIRYQIVFFVLSYIKSGKLKCLKCEGIKLQENSLRQNYFQVQEQKDLDKQTYFFSEFDDSSNKSPSDKLVYQQFQLTSHNIRELNFSNNQFILTPIINSLTTYYNKIEVLDLSSCQPITEQDLDTLSLLVKKSTFLHNLNVSNLSLGYKSLECLKNFRRAVLISSLKSLSVSRNFLFTATKVFQVEEIIYNYKLEKLDYSNNGFQAKHATYIATIFSSYKNIQELNLSHNNIDFSGIIMISKYSKENLKLKHLNLSNQKLRADDLLIISHIISNYNLVSLNLSNNNSIKRMKTFFNLCSSKQIDILHLNHIDFDKLNMLNCVDTINKSKKHIIGAIIDFCNFRKQDYEKLSLELIKCKNLQVLSMNYNPFIYLDLDKAALLLNETKKIKILEFTQITFTGKSLIIFADWLQKEKCIVETLKLGDSPIKQEWFDELCKGVANNKTIKNLIFEKLDLGSLSLYQFGGVISQNQGLQVVSLENNKITDNLLQIKQALIEMGKQIQLKKLNLSKNPIIEHTLIDFFKVLDGQLDFSRIQEISLDSCQLELKLLGQYNVNNGENLNKMYLSNAISLSLSNNDLTDEHCVVLAKFLSQPNQIEYLCLSQNRISSVGISKILNIISNATKLRLLDVSQNIIDDEFTFKLQQFCQKEINLQFLLLRGNNFSQLGQKCLSSILNQQEFLFIDNIWSSIDDEDADHILQQYTKVGQKFQLNQKSLPQYVKEILLLKSNLTDKFCKSFGKYYPLLNFIELIDISDNPYITMYGKTYLFFYLFDFSFEKHNLTAMYITNSQEYRNLYDDGLLRYFTLGFRNFLLPFNSNNNQVLQSSKIETSEKIFGGLIGSWILHKVNKILFYLDLIQPPTFIVSTLFIGKFRKKNTTLKLLIGFYLFAFTFMNIIQFRNLARIDKSNLQKCLFQEVLEGNCDLEHEQNFNNFTYTLICFSFILIIDFSQLVLMVILRRKIKPALQIVYPKMIYKLHSKFPNNREWILMIYSIFRKFETLPERMFLPLFLKINPSYDEILKYQLLFTIFILWRGCDQLLGAYLNFIQFFVSNPREDQASYLSLLQRNLFNMNYQIPSDILASFCPIIGYQINKSFKLSSAVIIESYRIICFDIPLLIIICQFSKSEALSNHLSTLDLMSSEFTIWLIFFFIKCVVSIIFSLISILTLRPAVVKQDSFNQALAIKRFHINRSQFVKAQDLKIEESIKMIIEKIDKIGERRLFSLKELKQKIARNRNIDLDMKEILEEDEVTFKTGKSDEQLSDLSVSSIDSPQSPLKSNKIKSKYQI